MVDALIKIFIGLLVVLTLFIGVKQPKMHEKIQIYDSSYTTVADNDSKKEEKVVKKEVVELPAKETVKSENIVQRKEAENPFKQEVKVQVQKNVQVKKEPEKKVQTQSSTNTQTKEQAQTKTQTQTKVETPKPTTTTTVKQEEQTQEEKMTQEELIAWNVWHSNIQNSLMRDVRMPYIPDGIVFKFSFTVDKYGKITNINTYSTTSKYTPYAIEYIAPVIRSYQGKSILDFPADSKRTTTFFTGGWKMSSSESKYSKPSDYNDVEKVIK